MSKSNNTSAEPKFPFLGEVRGGRRGKVCRVGLFFILLIFILFLPVVQLRAQDDNQPAADALTSHRVYIHGTVIDDEKNPI